jgi:hypothetical protein
VSPASALRGCLPRTLPLIAGLVGSVRVLQSTSGAQHAFTGESLQMTRDVRFAVESINAWQRTAGPYFVWSYFVWASASAAL